MCVYFVCLCICVHTYSILYPRVFVHVHINCIGCNYSVITTYVLYVSFVCFNFVRKTTKSSGSSKVGPTDPEESDPGSLHPGSSDADNKRTKHRVLHTFQSWGAVDHDCSSEGQQAEHQYNAELSPDDISKDHYEVIDLQQSSQQQRLFEEMLKRKVRMEQAVLSVNQGMGEWLRADSESSLLRQEAVGYTVPSGKRSAASDKHNSWSHLTTNSKNSPQFPRKRSFPVNSEDYNFVLPGCTDSDEDSSIF